MVAEVPLADGADRAQLLSQLLEREALTSTGLGEGFAVPHPRTPSTAFTDEPIVMLALPRPSLDWGSLDGQKVHAVFLLVNPTPAAHLKVLSRLAFVLRDEGFANLLSDGTGFEEVLTAAAQLEPRG